MWLPVKVLLAWYPPYSFEPIGSDMSSSRNLDLRWNEATQSFEYGANMFGPLPEHRRLDAIRASLLDPQCSGPDPVYSIVMDVGREEHKRELVCRNLLFGVVSYPAGRLGREPVRSQGHIHKISLHSGWSAPELFEIWEGTAIVYAQESTSDDPGRCLAVTALPGDQVVVPPGWAHCVINANPHERMIFAACCDRDYGFVYDGVRARRGLAWFPILDENSGIRWEGNPRYRSARLEEREARAYPELGLSDTSIYGQFAQAPESLQWVSEPSLFATLWSSFEP